MACVWSALVSDVPSLHFGAHLLQQHDNVMQIRQERATLRGAGIKRHVSWRLYTPCT